MFNEPTNFPNHVKALELLEISLIVCIVEVYDDK